MAGGAVAILVPVLRRPHRAAPLVASIEAATPEPHRVLFVASPGDTAEQDAVRATGADLLVIDRTPGCGDYARKVNNGHRATREPFLFLAADDLAFYPGWLTAALAHVERGASVVGTNDLGNPRVLRGDHATHSLVTRSYIDEHGTIDQPGTVLHEGYQHEYVDDELVGTAKHRGVWSFAADSIVEHLHPHWGKAPTDDLYDAQAHRLRASRSLFIRRRRLWT